MLFRGPRIDSFAFGGGVSKNRGLWAGQAVQTPVEGRGSGYMPGLLESKVITPAMASSASGKHRISWGWPDGSMRQHRGRGGCGRGFPESSNTLTVEGILGSSVQFRHSVVSLRPHGLQHARLPCPSPTPGTYSNACPSSR